ncbi:MDR family oxidoreductase [Humidisolicoccus flavus]|uniref:MDR family oxidoreductase n=1 Tax=Humidisolicoccus flavus TaxID=3111414 RepID=UPI003252D323
MAVRALLATKESTKLTTIDEAELLEGTGRSEGDVTVNISHSSINFKDGMALTGRPGIVKEFPLVPGIDLVGTVAEDSASFSAGDRVLINGNGLGETHHGGFAEIGRFPADWLTRVPENFSDIEAAAIGTAGFTAMLSVLALERAGVTAGSETLVTGAAGGVGSVAIALLSKLGHRVTASTGRIDEEGDWLRALGAAELLDRNELSEENDAPLQSARWDAAVDSVGGTTLANVLAQTKRHGHVTACGLVGGMSIPANVGPFILRAVTLHGVNSVFETPEIRDEAWSRLATDLDPKLLASTIRVVGLSDAIEVANEIIAGRVRGRTVVDVRA